MTFIDDPDLPFCPGCSHEPTFEALAAALGKLALDPRRVVVVSDIGCHGIADRAFAVHTFHGLHGRSITYACGVKLARPDARVVVLIGDGGCGIGATHLVNAARRNAGVCVLVFDNFNFGMTGGQHSVTTPAGARTATTPGGNVERSLDLCALARAAGATFTARATAFDESLADVIAAAVAHDGFALVDVWGLCTAHYVKRNDLRKSRLRDGARSAPGPAVERRDGVPEWAWALRPRAPAGAPPEIESLAVPVEFASPLGRRTALLLAGSAGMRMRSAGSLITRAAVMSGLWAAQRDTYPVTVMKGHSLCEIVIAPEPVESLDAGAPDRLVVASRDGWEKTRALHASAGRILCDRSVAAIAGDEIVAGAAIAGGAAVAGRAEITRRAEIVDLPGVRRTEIGLSLGAYAVADLVPPEALREAVRRYGHAGDRARLLEAVERGLAVRAPAG